MKYLNSDSIKELGISWSELTETIEDAIQCLEDGQTVQPIKPYLRFKDMSSRIISMPAYLGNEFDIAGIKWIARIIEFTTFVNYFNCPFNITGFTDTWLSQHNCD